MFSSRAEPRDLIQFVSVIAVSVSGNICLLFHLLHPLLSSLGFLSTLAKNDVVNSAVLGNPWCRHS